MYKVTIKFEWLDTGETEHETEVTSEGIDVEHCLDDAYGKAQAVRKHLQAEEERANMLLDDDEDVLDN